MKLGKTNKCLSLILGLIMTSSVAYADEKVETNKTGAIQSLLKLIDDEICHPFPECLLPDDDDISKNSKKRQEES